MKINEEIFFKEATLKICSSLDINTALLNLFKYLKEHINFNSLNLFEFDKRNCVAKRIATVIDYNNINENIVFNFSTSLCSWLQNVRDPFITTNKNIDSPVFELVSLAKLNMDSALCVPLSVEDEPTFFLILRTEGKASFSPYCLRLLAVVAKPFAIALNNAVNYETILKQRDNLIDDNRFLSREILVQGGAQIIGANTGLRDVLEMVRQVAPQKTTVLLMGETGTGKEIIANTLHFASPRKDRPFIKLNCGAIAENLIDSELFGHERGAFTGAVAATRGRFERANGGTLFLDEIGELPPQSQVRLLRVLQNGIISRVGGEKDIPVDVRIIAATNRNLKEMVSEGRFREDLWFRLTVFPITIPPLRQRKEDISSLARYFVEQKCKELNLAALPAISPTGYDQLTSYDWPGNVRELENVIERALIRHQKGQLRFDSLLFEQNDIKRLAPKPLLKPQDGPLDLAEVTSRHILNVLQITNGRVGGVGGAAELLGLNVSTLRGKMRQLGIPSASKERSDYLGIQKNNTRS